VVVDHMTTDPETEGSYPAVACLLNKGSSSAAASGVTKSLRRVVMKLATLFCVLLKSDLDFNHAL
jgi:hypothetical protein